MRDIISKLEELNVEKEQLNEGLGDMAHEAEMDHEVQMARSDLYKTAKYAVAIHKMMKDVSEMEGVDGWVAAKITKAADYLSAVKHHMEGEMMADVELAVVPVAGDMTDAMTMPQESTEEVHEEEVAEGRMSMRQLASMDKDAARRIEAMVGPESKYADMGDYQEALYRAAMKMGLIRENIEEEVVSEDREVMVRATNIKYDGPALDKLPTDVNVKVMVNPGDDNEEIYEMVADELEDRYGVKVSEFDMAMMEQDAIEEEDVIGDIIASLSKTKERMPMPKSKPAVPMQSKQKMANKMALPKSKPDRSMGQDKTTGDPGGILRQSKFSEWSKK